MADPSTAAAAAVPAGQPPPPQLPQCTTTAETETPPAAPSAVPATLGRVVKLETLVPRYAALPAGTATSPRPFARHPSPRPTVESRFLHEHAEGVAPFIIKLFDLVSDPESAHLITWSDEYNRQAFVVWDPVEFSSAILPNHFKHSNFCSFVRQLNIYGFRKLESKEGYVFQQENFRADAPELLRNIQRRKQAHKRPAHPIAEEPAAPETFAGKMERCGVDGSTLAPLQQPQPLQSTHAGNLSMLADAALAASGGAGESTPTTTATVLLPKDSGSTSTLLGVLNPQPPVPQCTGSSSNSSSSCTGGTGFACSDMNKLYTCLLAEISKLYRQNEETHKTIAQLRDVLSDSRRREQAIESQLQAVVQHLHIPQTAAGSVQSVLSPPNAYLWDVLNRPPQTPDAPQSSGPPPSGPAAAAPHTPLILPNPQLRGGPSLSQLSGNKL